MNFKESYNRAIFQTFFRQFLPDDFELKNEPLIYSGCQLIQGIKLIGECKSLELKVYEIMHSSENDPRVTLSKEAFKLIQKYNSQRALVIFTSSNSQNYRLSLITFQRVQKSDTKVTKEFSNPRRYSFFLGPDAKVNTPAKFLIQKGKVKDFDDLLSRFSIEVVNKEFYQQIARFFSRLTGGERKFGSKTQHFEPEMILPFISLEDKKTYQEFTVRLIGRIIFCWFLKQKKSKEGISLLPDEFLSKEAVADSADYYHSILEKIFFEVLNKPINQRKSELKNGYNKIPYLNGGLFDPHTDDFYDNSQPNYGLKIPDSWFSELFEILETYNFTIDENTVLDVDLSIDPEMLGRIFENLLAEINPETGESARKSTGSYYTPRPIVEYMVDQSLIQYLITKTGVSEDKIKALVSVDESDDEIYPLTQEEKHKIVDALDEVKIIDPACGSGAFPIGILQKIVFVLGKIDQNGQLWFDKKTENLDSLLAEDFKKKFENENFDYIRKTGVIRDSIYGVDIQPIAVEVSKLRCFLTLIVDEDIDESAENRGIKPLPNLEFKFVAANTLFDLPGSGQNGSQIGMFEEDAEIKQLKQLRDQYFVSNGFDKERIKNKFKDVQKEMFKKQISKGGFGDMTMALADWDPFSDKSSSWFNPEWMFGILKFNIVIANPPYIVSNNRALRQIYSESVHGRANLYGYFIHMSIDKLLADMGILTYINPRTLLTDAYFSALRKYILNNCTILAFLNIVNRKSTFDNVLQSVMVDIFIKGRSSQKTSIKNIELVSDLYNKNNIYLRPEEIIFGKTNPIFLVASSTAAYGILKKVSESLTFAEKGIDFITGKIQWDLYKKSLSSIPAAHSTMLIWAENIQRYVFQPTKLRAGKQYINSELRTCKPISTRTIAVQRTTAVEQEFRIIAELIDPNNFSYPIQCENNTSYIEKNVGSVNLEIVLALLNSRLYDFIFRHINSNTHVSATELKSLPIPTMNDTISKDIASIVHKILETRKQDIATNTRPLEKEIDQIIYKVYGLTPEEIKIIEKSVGDMWKKD